jgi:spore germination cell wall hydrolase CwlJ-like protein
MIRKEWTRRARPQPKRHRRTALASPALVLIAASCVPAAGPGSRPVASAAAQPPEARRLAEVADQSAASAPAGEGALAANAALPFADALNPAASPFVVRAATGLDRLRSLDCMAQAIYYEAGSESEDGQRAVAQVVLNRVRHPAWPNSVCGVVYQGPMRPGGGCQFTFTCDGSLARRPGGEAWLRARRLAAEALGGRSYAPVGLSTHYHTNYVFPAWAPRLAKTTVIGAHIFYRLPGGLGEARAFSDAYAGREPFPRPAMTMVRPSSSPAFGSGLPGDFGSPAAAVPARGAERPQLEVHDLAVLPPPPPSQVREEYRHSGQWRADSPIAPPAPPPAQR